MLFGGMGECLGAVSIINWGWGNFQSGNWGPPSREAIIEFLNKTVLDSIKKNFPHDVEKVDYDPFNGHGFPYGISNTDWTSITKLVKKMEVEEMVKKRGNALATNLPKAEHSSSNQFIDEYDFGYGMKDVNLADWKELGNAIKKFDSIMSKLIEGDIKHGNNLKGATFMDPFGHSSPSFGSHEAPKATNTPFSVLSDLSNIAQETKKTVVNGMQNPKVNQAMEKWAPKPEHVLSNFG